MDRKRDELIAKVDGDREVTWDEVIRKSRVPKGDASTAAKRMKETFGIHRRIPRLKWTSTRLSVTYLQQVAVVAGELLDQERVLVHGQ